MVETVWSLKQKLLAAFFALAVVLGCGALVGCADNSEEEIHTAISEKLNAAQQLDETRLAAANEDELLSQLGYAFSIDPGDIVQALYGDFTYSIDNIEIDGDKATADVVLTVKDVDQLESTFAGLAQRLMADESLANMTAEEVNEKVGAEALEALNNMPTTTSTPIQVTCTKKDGKWQMSTDPATVVREAFFPTSVMNR